MFLTKTPFWLKAFYPNLIWHKSRNEKKVYLTFDDGPSPEITTWVLDQLEKYEAKGSFFLIGRNVKSHPEIVERIFAKGHRIGNHTQNHMNGWKNTKKDYLMEVDSCAELLDSNLFRPPYGRIKKAQAKAIKALGYDIIMWDVLSGDFDLKRSAGDCIKTVCKDVENGSILVFHDSNKAWPRLKECLPQILEFLKEEGYKMEKL